MNFGNILIEAQYLYFFFNVDIISAARDIDLDALPMQFG